MTVAKGPSEYPQYVIEEVSGSLPGDDADNDHRHEIKRKGDDNYRVIIVQHAAFSFLRKKQAWQRRNAAVLLLLYGHDQGLISAAVMRVVAWIANRGAWPLQWGA